MNNFYNKKGNHVDNDFEVESEDFLNSSMRDMNARTKSGKKKKINHDYEEGIQFVDLASLDQDTLFKSSNRSPENAEYMSTVLRGFIFIFMLLISLFAIFLIFKTPYYSYYNQDTPIVLDENKNMMEANPFAQNPQTQQSLEEEIIEPEENNVKLPTAIISKPKISDEDEMLRREFENSRSAKNKQDTELTKLLKNSDTVVVKEKTIETPPIIESKKIENKVVDNLPQDHPAQEISKVGTEKNNKKSSGVFKYPAMGDKKMVTDNAQILAQNDTTNTEKSKLESIAKSPVKKEEAKPVQPNISKETQGNKPNNIAEQSVWLVNIYSTQNKNDIHERLIRLKNQYKNALAGTTFYLVDYNTAKGITYRISVTENHSGISHPSFATNTEAKSFCDNLKSQGLDCFISSVNKSSLPRYIIK